MRCTATPLARRPADRRGWKGVEGAEGVERVEGGSDVHGTKGGLRGGTRCGIRGGTRGGMRDRDIPRSTHHQQRCNERDNEHLECPLPAVGIDVGLAPVVDLHVEDVEAPLATVQTHTPPEQQHNNNTNNISTTTTSAQQQQQHNNNNINNIINKTAISTSTQHQQQLSI